MSKEDFKKLIVNYRRRLQALQERKALYGLDTPIAIQTEIEDVQAEIGALEIKLSEDAESHPEITFVTPTYTQEKSSGVKISILIADDHMHEREGFRRLLSLVDDIEVIDEATSAQEAVRKALILKPHVVLLDLTWYKDHTAGISAIQQIKAEAPQIKILAATVHTDLIEAARMEGADLAVDKDSLYDKSALAARIRDAYESQAFPKPQHPLIADLSEREVEVLRLIAQGETDQRIGEQLGIQVPTVKKHVSSILSKLEVSNRAGAAIVGYKRGILKRGILG